MIKLFHKEVFWPNLVLGQLARYQNKTIGFIFTRHSLSECLKDRYSPILPPPKFVFDLKQVFECELTNSLISKFAVRLEYDSTHDLIMVLIPDGDKAIVKTCWKNCKTDAHKTLNTSQYCLSI